MQSFFFRFPWNNFLHNVVYDVVQQVFNGPMDRGFNRSLAIDLFESGQITELIIDGQRRSDETQKSSHLRLGYMGHLTLIAEEVVKFTERHPPEVLSDPVMNKVLHPDWVDYVERTLSETRERDNAILGGVRPDVIGMRQAVLNAAGVSQGFTASSALANAGLNGGVGSAFEGFETSNAGSSSSVAFGLSGSSGFGSSSDDEDEEMEDQDDDEPKSTEYHSAEGSSENVGDYLSTDIEMTGL
jgi:SIT4-associating protein SAP185/190